jgi:glycosyltransferase involved in cell wall biosynthesis
MMNELAADKADWSKLPKSPLVSVCMVTYNHERFIAQAIEGVVAQKCDFDIELVIGEDCSTDRTLEVVLEYQRLYPGLIRVLTSKTNLGGAMNFKRTLSCCRGRYLAICEGDDFWTDNSKLARQAEFLEDNPGTSISFHDSFEVDENGNKLNDSSRFRLSKLSKKCCLSQKEIISGAYIPAQSVMTRNILEARMSPSATLANGDWYRLCMLATKGVATCIPRTMAAYRIHKNGVWNGRSVTSQYFERLRSAIVIEHDLPPHFSWMVASTLRWHIADVLVFCAHDEFPDRNALLAKGIKAMLHGLVCNKMGLVRWPLFLYYINWIALRFIKHQVVGKLKH